VHLFNVIEQCRDIIKTTAIQQSYQDNGFPIVHAWVFDLWDGLAKDLKLAFENELEGIKKVYNSATGPTHRASTTT
jgi:carbonic anhydrase